MSRFVIITKHDPPPIPTREHDWQAWLDGEEERGTATGPSEYEALQELVEMMDLWGLIEPD